MPLPHRQSAKFKLAETELHDDLGLRWEHTFMSASVLDRVFDAHGEKPHERTHDERLRAFEVRQQLLAAAGLSEKVAS